MDLAPEPRTPQRWVAETGERRIRDTITPLVLYPRAKQTPD